MRLIDADTLYASLEELYDRFGCEAREVHFSLLDMKMNIEGEETVDAVPVRHGRWLFDGKSKCSECGQTALYYMGITWCSDYCPHCGAKMNEVEDG